MTITELETAINNARKSEPSDGRESALSKDVSLMASVYGELIFRGHKAFDLDSLPERTRIVIKTWTSQPVA